MKQRKVPTAVSRYLAGLGRKGGSNRAQALTPEQRRASSVHAAQSRWRKHRQRAEELNQHLLNRWTEIKAEPIGTSYVSGFPPFKVKRSAGRTLYGFQAGDQLLDIDQVAERLAVPKGTVYELCRRRSRIHGNPLPHFKVGRRLKFNWSGVVAWLDALEKAGAR